MRLERLTDEQHLARFAQEMNGSPVNPIVIAAASHCLALTNRRIVRRNRWDYAYRSLAFYPIDEIQRFFQALRLVTGYDTGYGQLVTRPVGWATEYVANLPPLMLGPTTRDYPDKFDDGGWLREVSVVSLDQLRSAGRTTGALASANRKVILAARRLGFSMLRARDDDKILDLCIGLEALLGDDSGGEITHKLAMRVAAVYAQARASTFSPSSVFESMKRVYRYRSLVAHGSDPTARRMVAVTTPEGEREEVPAILLAEHYLRVCLVVLLRDASWQNDSARIDHEVILGSMDRTRDHDVE